MSEMITPTQFLKLSETWAFIVCMFWKLPY